MPDHALGSGPRYTSVLIELLRLGSDEDILKKDTPYLVQVDDNPVREMRSPIGHLEFLDRLSELDYAQQPETRATAFDALSDVATRVLDQARLTLPAGPVQIDLVVSAAELTMLPFEMAKDKSGKFLFVQGQPQVEVTRRVRLGFNHKLDCWRAKPRILLVSASPPGAGNTVPLDMHKARLRNALRPWIEPLRGFPEAVPDERTVLKFLDKATLAAIRDTCAEAVRAKSPFTHVHILAHGVPIGKDYRRHFGIALHAEDGTLAAVEPQALADALQPVTESCAVVTLAICESGNLANTILPGSSIAHVLHARGVPVVIGAQFPLTFDGSGIFVECFYGALLQGKDVRAALHETRTALFKRRDIAHNDWASLVGYVRLPERYADHLISVSLESDFASLQTAQCWSDHIVENEGCAQVLDFVAQQLSGRISNLKARLEEAEKCGRRGVLEENRGLLGSAEKRLAETCFHLWRRRGHAAEHRTTMLDALHRSRDWYEMAYLDNLSHHWTGVQMLSLYVVLEGNIDQPDLWFTARTAARKAMENPRDYWAAGSMAEICLLASCAGQPTALSEAEAVLLDLKSRTREFASDNFPIESTLRQLRRYQQWWTKENGFFPNNPDLKDDARRLVSVLLSDDMQPAHGSAGS